MRKLLQLLFLAFSLLIGNVALGQLNSPKQCLAPDFKSCPSAVFWQCTETPCDYTTDYRPVYDDSTTPPTLYFEPNISYGTCDGETERVERDMADEYDCEYGTIGTPTSIAGEEKQKVCYRERACKLDCQVSARPRETIYYKDENGNDIHSMPVVVYWSLCESTAASIDDTVLDALTSLQWIECVEYSNCENGEGPEEDPDSPDDQ